MKPALAQFGSEYPVVEVDMDQKNSDTFKNNIKYFTGRGIPHTVVVDGSGKVLHRMTGGRSYADLKKETAKFFR